MLLRGLAVVAARAAARHGVPRARGARARARPQQKALDHRSHIAALPQPSVYDSACGLLLRRAPVEPPPGPHSEDASASAVAAAIATHDLRSQLPEWWVAQ